jgi:hypothetical protein
MLAVYCSYQLLQDTWRYGCALLLLLLLLL